jgi:NitT/TauT family transport system substrate-binding protein
LRYVLWESFRAVFYTPYYAALQLRAYEKHGLDVQFGAVPPGVHIGRALRAGQVDVVWGGPMRVMLDRDQNPESDTMCFCEVVARDPFFLVGREPNPEFSLSELTNLRVATVSEVPTPWMCLQEDMRRAGLDPDTVTRIADNTMKENVNFLLNGDVDVIQIFEPDVEKLIRAGKGHVWYVAAARGLTSYTTLYATKRFLAEHADAAEKFVRGVYDAQKWILAHTAEDLTKLVSDFFPDLERPVLAGAIDRYLQHKVWGETPILSEEGFDRQASGLASGGLISRKPAYDECVDMSFARKVLGGVDRV